MVPEKKKLNLNDPNDSDDPGCFIFGLTNIEWISMFGRNCTTFFPQLSLLFSANLANVIMQRD